ncbi:MAG: efflux RND transporter periplasmic adaptor subunit [Gammaproteobacteria bacterium]|nr:efflux RND transporter periplasmic adaptor subunit [Gammaproteobacteria bacterium]
MNRNWIYTLAFVGILAAGSYAAFLAMREPPLPDGIIYGNGHVEGVEIRVTAEVTGRVLESSMVEAQQIGRGELLVQLDTDEINIELAGTLAEKKSLTVQLKALQAEVTTGQHHLKTAEAELVRIRRLSSQQLASRAQLDRAENDQRDAGSQLAARLAQLDMVVAQIEVVEHRAELLRTRRDKARITAPLSGTVLVKGVEPGEVVLPGQIIAVMVDLSQMELKVYVPETDIGRIKLGTAARIRVDAFPHHWFEGRVARVDANAQFTPRAVHMPDERVRMVFGVTLDVDNPDGFLKPGMPADAWLRWDPSQAWPDELLVPGR